VIDAYAGLHVINVSDPTSPILVGIYDTPGYTCDVYVAGDYAYVADYSSLVILRFAPTRIEEEGNLPDDFWLSQNYPNPFNARTFISYSLPKASLVTISIYDMLGHKLETLAGGEKPAGCYQAIWNAGNKSSGIYFYKIQAGDFSETKKMLLLK
jgi:hypothetical protein